MTKGGKYQQTRIANTLQGMTARFGGGTPDLADAVRALDVCTPAEREFIDAGADAPFDGATPRQLARYRAAWDALIAERTPPDPVETFIAEICAATRHLPAASVARIDAALAKLDAARDAKRGGR